MAKKETRVVVALKCKDCKKKNYTTYKSKQIQEKLSNKKYCPTCNKHTLHEEAKIK